MEKIHESFMLSRFWGCHVLGQVLDHLGVVLSVINIEYRGINASHNDFGCGINCEVMWN